MLLLICAVHSTPPAFCQDTNVLKTGEGLQSKYWLVSSNGAFFSIMQTDGNLCIYRGSKPVQGFEPTKDDGPAIWCSGKTSPGGVFNAVLGRTGNFCVYRGPGPSTSFPPVWCSNTAGSSGDYFATLRVDGNLVIYTGTPADPGNVVWQSGVSYPPVTLQQPPTGSSIQWPDGQSCPPLCTRNYPAGSTIRLTASTTQTNFLVREWTGTQCAAGPSTPICDMVVPSYSEDSPIVGIKYLPPNTVAIRYARGPISVWWGPTGQFTMEESGWDRTGGLWVFDDGLIRFASKPTMCIAERLGAPSETTLYLKTCDRTDTTQNGWTFVTEDSTIRKAVDPAACLQKIDRSSAPYNTIAFIRGQPCPRNPYDPYDERLLERWILMPY